jgi:small subunit ribosomal protein S13
MAEIKHIIRVANTDLDGHKPIKEALKKIKGVSFMYSNMLCVMAGVNKTKKAGELNDTEVKAFEDILENPDNNNVPDWMRNRRKDYETGEDIHVTGPQIKFVKEMDLRRLKKIKSNRGLRHQWGLPVRGQRTKSNFRKTKGKAVGVKRKGK